MDVHIGEIEATIRDTGGDGINDAMLKRIVREVLARLEARHRHDVRAAHDRKISSTDSADVERYG